MAYKLTAFFAAAALASAASPVMAAETPNDAQIAHIAYTAGAIDVTAAKQALAKSQNVAVRDFARTMVRDHEAVNAKALELVKSLKVTPEENAASQALTRAADETIKRFDNLRGGAFDAAYLANEVAFHKAVNGALESTLIPSAKSDQLKSLLQTGLALFREHQTHAEQLAATMK